MDIMGKKLCAYHPGSDVMIYDGSSSFTNTVKNTIGPSGT